MVSTIIFDWGGVLIENPEPKIVSYCSNHLGIDEETFRKARNKFLIQFQKGIPEKDFWEEVCNELKIEKPRTNSLWADAFGYAYSPIEEMFSLASSLSKTGYRVAMLSNTEKPATHHLDEQRYAVFNPIILSCIEEEVKPEQRIYNITVRRIRINPENALFIDDKIENVDGARSAGMSALLFTNKSQLEGDLGDYITRKS